MHCCQHQGSRRCRHQREIPRGCAEVVVTALPGSGQPWPTMLRGEIRALLYITFSQSHTRPFLWHRLSRRTAWPGDPECVFLGFLFWNQHRRVKWYQVRITVSQLRGAQIAPRRQSPAFLIVIMIGHGIVSSLIFHVVVICSYRWPTPFTWPFFSRLGDRGPPPFSGEQDNPLRTSLPNFSSG